MNLLLRCGEYLQHELCKILKPTFKITKLYVSFLKVPILKIREDIRLRCQKWYAIPIFLDLLLLQFLFKFSIIRLNGKYFCPHHCSMTSKAKTWSPCCALTTYTDSSTCSSFGPIHTPDKHHFPIRLKPPKQLIHKLPQWGYIAEHIQKI